MSAIILPFVEPITACYPATSGASGILFADETLHDWMFNNFIQIFEVEGNHALDYYDFAIDNNPYLSYNEIDYSFIYHNWESIISFIISSIKENYYIRIFVNKSKLYLYDDKANIQHDLLIYGCDEENSLFHVADHFRNGQFSMQTCSFTDLVNAIDTYDVNRFEKNPPFLNCVQLIKKEPSLLRLRFSMYTSDQMNYICNLNLNRILLSLDDYLNGKPTVNWYTRGRAMDKFLESTHKWGIDCYDILIFYVQYMEENDNLNAFANQSFYIMYNHKQVMIERIKAIHRNYSLPNYDLHLKNFQELCLQAYDLAMIYLKQTVQCRIEQVDYRKTSQRIIKSITQLKELDYQYTDALQNDITLITR